MRPLSCLLFLMYHASHWLLPHHFLAKLGKEPHCLSLLDLEAATDPAFPAPPTFTPSLTFLPLGPLPGLHAPQPLHPHLSLQPFPDFPWRESQGKKKDYSAG